jgi:hypothetical protein
MAKTPLSRSLGDRTAQADDALLIYGFNFDSFSGRFRSFKGRSREASRPWAAWVKMINLAFSVFGCAARHLDGSQPRFLMGTQPEEMDRSAFFRSHRRRNLVRRLLSFEKLRSSVNLLTLRGFIVLLTEIVQVSNIFMMIRPTSMVMLMSKSLPKSSSERAGERGEKLCLVNRAANNL